MSEIPSSEVDLDRYCHKLYQEKVKFYYSLLGQFIALCRTSYCVNFMKREDLTARSMNGMGNYDGRYSHTPMHCFGVFCLCFLPAYWL